MAISQEQKNFTSHVVEMLQGVGPVYSKRMFGGFGIFLDGMMFGLVADSTLYIKVDDANRDEFLAEGLQPFTYDKQGKLMQLSYYQAPEEALENLEVMTNWGNSGFGAALRAASKGKSRKSDKVG